MSTQIGKDGNSVAAAASQIACESKPISEQVRDFGARCGKTLFLNRTSWRYYRLGSGPAIVWLTGGLRRAALGYAFLEQIAKRYTLIAPDYPPLQTVDAFCVGLDTILQIEGVERYMLVGQSYGGLLAQAYLAQHVECVERLILSSSGPADYGKAWLPVEYLAMGLIRFLPEQAIKNVLFGRLRSFICVPEGEHLQWLKVIKTVIEDDLSRADILSHFAVAADIIRSGIISPAGYRAWLGSVIVLSATNDPTQRASDLPRYERLFGRSVKMISLGNLGHTAMMADPVHYVALLEQVLA